MNILPFREGGQQAFIPRQVRHNAQLDLRVVRRDNDVIFRRDKRLANTAPFFVTHRNVLQVWIGRRQTAGGGDRLMIGGMHAARFGVNHQRQLIGIGRLQLRQPTILQNHFRQRIIERQLFQHLFRGGRRTARRLLQRLDTLFFKQDRLQLFGGGEIKRFPGDLMCPLLQLNQALGNFLRVRMQHGGVDFNAVALNARQHRHQRHFNVLEDIQRAFMLL